jgi:Uma2 family endonuclease
MYLWTESTGGGVAFGSNAGFNLPDGSCLSPDAAWLAMGRWNALTAEEQAGFPPVCPEFVIEIRSRSDSRRLLETKMQLWLENGAQVAWLIDPVDSEVLIYEAGLPVQVLQRPEMLRGSGPVTGFRLPCARLWPAHPNLE